MILGITITAQWIVIICLGIRMGLVEKELDVTKKALIREIKIWQMRNRRNVDGM